MYTKNRAPLPPLAEVFLLFTVFHSALGQIRTCILHLLYEPGFYCSEVTNYLGLLLLCILREKFGAIRKKLPPLIKHPSAATAYVGIVKLIE